MDSFNFLGKYLLVIGIVLIVLGLIILYGPKIPYIGRLPGDIIIKRGNFRFYFPLTTCVLLSLILMLIAYLIRK